MSAIKDAGASVVDKFKHLNLSQAGADAQAGFKAGVAIGGAVGAAAGAWFPGLPAISGPMGALYGAIYGSAIGFIHGLFVEDPAYTREKARLFAESMQNAGSALNAMFATWPPAARRVFVETPMYQEMVAWARNPDKYRDPLILMNDPKIREAIREQLRIATISPENPSGIVFGNPEIKALVADRLRKRAGEVNAGFVDGTPAGKLESEGYKRFSLDFSQIAKTARGGSWFARNKALALAGGLALAAGIGSVIVVATDEKKEPT